MPKQETTRQQLSLKSQLHHKGSREEEEISNIELQKKLRMINKVKGEIHKLVTELKEDMNKQLKELKENSNK
jgi:hypothetical protein